MLSLRYMKNRFLNNSLTFLGFELSEYVSCIVLYRSIVKVFTFLIVSITLLQYTKQVISARVYIPPISIKLSWITCDQNFKGILSH